MSTIRRRCVDALGTRLAEQLSAEVRLNYDGKITLAPGARWLILRDGVQTASYADTGVVTYDMTVTVEGLAGGSDVTAALEAADGLYDEVVQAIAQDPTLGGIAIDVTEREFRPDDVVGDYSGVFGAFALDLAVTFQTKVGLPSVGWEGA